MTESNDTLRALLDGRVQNIQKYIDRLKGDRDTARRLIDNIAPVLEQAERDLNEALASIGILFGQTAPLAPRDIRSDENALGLRVGPLQMGPPSSEAPTRDLDFYRATMRALADQANHQARLVGDELARREQASDVPTGAFPAVQPNLPKWAGRQLGEKVRLIAHDGEEARGSIAKMTEHDIMILVGDVPYTISDFDLASIETYPPTAVQPGDATQVISAVPWAHLVGMPLNAGLAVTVHWVDGGSKTGTVFDITPDRLVIGVGGDTYDLAPADVRLVEPAGTGEPYYPPADLDQVTATPAQQDGGQG